MRKWRAHYERCLRVFAACSIHIYAKRGLSHPKCHDFSQHARWSLTASVDLCTFVIVCPASSAQMRRAPAPTRFWPCVCHTSKLGEMLPHPRHQYNESACAKHNNPGRCSPDSSLLPGLQCTLPVPTPRILASLYATSPHARSLSVCHPCLDVCLSFTIQPPSLRVASVRD